MSDVARESESREFFAAAPSRALRVGFVFAIALVTAAFAFYGRSVGLAALAGVIVGGLNTYWLARSTAAFARRAVQSADSEREQRKPSSGGILFQYVLRYLLVAVAAYGIFKSTLFSILGFFAGLFLPVVSLMFEAFYEAWVSHRRGL